jgi:low affinity Fe/Cu permease
MSLSTVFQHFANKTSRAAGQPLTFVSAVTIIVLWALCGPMFGFSDTWQLIINTSTTIVTFLMVFLIQNTQNRDGEAMQIKLDELIRAVKEANNAMIDLEQLDEAELDRLRETYILLAQKARRGVQAGKDSAEIIQQQLDEEP